MALYNKNLHLQVQRVIISHQHKSVGLILVRMQHLHFSFKFLSADDSAPLSFMNL